MLLPKNTPCKSTGKEPMRPLVPSSLVILVLGALLGGCAAMAPPTASPTPADLAQLKSGQKDLSTQVSKLRNNLMLVEARLQDQQKTITSLQQALEAKKVTPTGEKTENSGGRGIPASGAATPSKSAASSSEIYLQAFGDYAAGRFQQSVQGFESFLRLHPNSDYAGNAQYWLGECYYSLHRYDRAVEALQKVVDRYPRGSKAPDALLRMADALRKMNQSDRAGQVLEQLRNQYPDSPAARSSGQSTFSQ